MLVAALALSACAGGGDGEHASRAEVTVKTFMFDPDPLEIEPGTKVTWVNRDATVHTVTGDRMDGRLKPSGGRFSATFDKPGTYRYFCSRHSGPGMQATVVVG